MRDVEGKVAVITGAASGIGLRHRPVLREGRHEGLVLADIEPRRSTTLWPSCAAAAPRRSACAPTSPASSRSRRWRRPRSTRFGAVHVLCNNAGVGIAAPIGQTSMADWEWTIDIDLWGPIYGVKTFLPIMERQGEGHINSTASMAGLIAGASLGAYNVAKHGVVALMASLERDLRLAELAVHASVLCPGPINTNIVPTPSATAPPSPPRRTSRRRRATKFWRNADRPLAEGMDPDEVGPMVLDAVQNDRFWVLTHPDMARYVERQVEAMVADRSLPRA